MEDQPEAESRPKENGVAGWAGLAARRREERFQRWLVDKIGLTKTLSHSLNVTDDDWAFIIKIHALIEVALNHLIAGGLAPLGRDLSEIVERMNVQGKVSKTAFAEALGFDVKPCLKFIKVMSDARRYLVHDIKHFDFDLAAYIRREDKIDEWKRAVTFNLGATPPDWAMEYAVQYPRFAIFRACMTLMSWAFAAQPPEPGELLDLYRMLADQAANPAEPPPSLSSPTELP